MKIILTALAFLMPLVGLGIYICIDKKYSLLEKNSLKDLWALQWRYGLDGFTSWETSQEATATALLLGFKSFLEHGLTDP